MALKYVAIGLGARRLSDLAIQDMFTERNYRAFFSQAVEVLVRPWEKHILSMKFSEVGGMLSPPVHAH